MSPPPPPSNGRSWMQQVRWRGALRHRNFRLYWLGLIISRTGFWMQTVALAWLVLLLTDDPFWLGVIAAVQFTPVLALSVFGGIIADVLPKRATIIGTQTMFMISALLLGGLTWAGWITLWHVGVIAFALGVVNAVDTPTRQAFLMEMVGREDVTSAVGLNSATFNAGRVVGPAVAGVAIGLVGPAICFLLNGVGFIAVIACLVAMRPDALRGGIRLLRPNSVAEVKANLGEGIRYVRVTPVVLLAVGLVGVVSTIGMNFNVLIPSMAIDVLAVGPSGFGFLMSAVGLGALVAALAIAVLGRPRLSLLLAGALALGVFELLLAGMRVFPVALLAAFGMGAGAIAMTATANSTIQLAVPDALRGRVLGVYTTVFDGAAPMGGLLAGWMASTFGTPVALAFGGAASTLAAVVATVWVRHSRRLSPSISGNPQLVAPMDISR